MATLLEHYPARSGPAVVNACPGPGDTDDILVRGAQHGDRAAFGILYDRYARMVHGILLSRVPVSVAEDLVQEVFLQALPRVASLRDASRFPGWLAAIARNAANDYYRRAKPALELHDDSGDPETRRRALDIPRSSQCNAESLAVLEAIRSLPDAYRETLVLRLVEGMTGPQIAARTGLTHGSVRVNLHRGMQQLREILSRKASPATGGDL
ncbi:MAG TPA: sigma-70 family RNA polymerase sigma factor [Candidatus Acidoferrum sp.]|nr:sigma-70 family RNA polymerase sigma factor [Candidatus Acidoferrum sp.]